MHALLFRKVEMNGVNYYQLYSENKDFIPDSSFADYNNRSTKDFFYLDADSDIEIPEPELLNLYYDDNNELKCLNDASLFEEVFNKFKEKYNIVIHEIKPIKEVVKNVSKKIMFQDNAVADLVRQIYINQSIMASDLPIELKVKLKNNILFHGPFGSGKKSIVECLEKELGFPYADVTVTSTLKDALEDIIKQLLSRSKNGLDANYGVVYIRDNYINLMKTLEDNVYTATSFFTEKGPIEYNGNIVDFRTLTFVVLFDERPDFDLGVDIDSVMEMADCNYRVATKPLTDKEKYQILFSPQGRLTLYEKFLNEYGHNLIIDDDSLEKIIKETSKVDYGMNILNAIIDGLMKENLSFEGDDMYIDEKSLETILPALSSLTGDYSYKKEIKEEKKESIQEQVFDEELDKIVKIITKEVVGQDKQVKSILYTILENRRMINRTDLGDPKKYIKNILIRGESGSGKTMIIEKISKLLKIPIFIADSTQYTETGWAGESVTDMLASLVHAAGGDVEAAQKGILFIDEVDKKATTDSHGGPSRGAVLDNLLKTIEGADVSVNIGSRFQEEKILFNTSKLTVICSGAFEGLEDYRDKRLGRKRAGFERETKKDADLGFTTDDFILYGMNRQFMSRLPKLVELNKVTKESLINVMKNSDVSQLKIEKFKLEDRGIEVEYTEDFYEGLAEEALKKNIGNRGIEQALTKVLDSINIEDIKSSEVSKIILNKEVIKDPSKVILINRIKQKKMIK